jgi:hypothetical protein
MVDGVVPDGVGDSVVLVGEAGHVLGEVESVAPANRWSNSPRYPPTSCASGTGTRWPTKPVPPAGTNSVCTAKQDPMQSPTRSASFLN